MDDDSRVEDENVVEDTDADTRDVEEAEQNDYAQINDRLSRMETAIGRMSGIVSAMQKAQNSLVSMGAVIHEDDNPADDDGATDSFVPLEKLDFSI